MFRGFRLNDIIYPLDDYQQYGKYGATVEDLRNTKCIPRDVIKALPEYFECMITEDNEIEKFLLLYKEAKQRGLI